MQRRIRRALVRMTAGVAITGTALMSPVATPLGSAEVVLPTGFSVTAATLAVYNVTGSPVAYEQYEQFKAAAAENGVDVKGIEEYVVYQLPDIGLGDVKGDTDGENKVDTYLVVPEGVGVDTITSAYADGVLSLSGVLETIPVEALQDPIVKGAADGTGQPWWRERAYDCIWASNNTAWWSGCYTVNQLWNDADYSRDHYNLHYWATAKSKSTWRLYKFSVGSDQYGSTEQYWKDWNPRADEERGRCSTHTVGVTVKAVSFESSHQHCDEWDISKYADPGHFSNWWRGDAWRSEREVAMMVAVAVPNGKWPRWSIPYHYYAY